MTSYPWYFFSDGIIECEHGGFNVDKLAGQPTDEVADCSLESVELVSHIDTLIGFGPNAFFQFVTFNEEEDQTS